MKNVLRESREKWHKLPENVEKMKQRQRAAKYATFRLNAQCFNHRIQDEVLGRRRSCLT